MGDKSRTPASQELNRKLYRVRISKDYLLSGKCDLRGRAGAGGQTKKTPHREKHQEKFNFWAYALDGIFLENS